ncbi:MAG: SDR family NAD(P)-dependent oxidoreductase [Rhodospirillales bacterium]|nr:SDR family NAD(P)-dependent oxidoreductase [Rhodospirillales bacterium]
MKSDVALVIGATSDIGTAIAEALLRAGAEVLLQGRPSPRLVGLADRLAALGPCQAVAADLTRPDDIAELAGIVTRRGRLDTLILGSGIYERSNDAAALARQFAANVHGPYSILVALVPLLVAARGQILFLNSTQGLAAAKGLGQYAATQHALRAIADSLRAEVNPDGVRVLSMFLGRTATRRQRAIFALEGRPYLPERLIQPEDVAHAALAALTLPRTAEITQIMMRPMLNHEA